MIRHRPCTHCARVTRQEISRRVTANLAEHFGWWCLECKWWTESKQGGIWIPKELLIEEGVDLSLVRVVEVVGSAALREVRRTRRGAASLGSARDFRPGRSRGVAKGLFVQGVP